MNNSKQHTITVQIADVEPISFKADFEEEQIYRKAAFHVNATWQKMKEQQPGKSPHFILAKVALAYAELYHRKSEQLAAQSQLLDDFEKQLDSILLQMED